MKPIFSRIAGTTLIGAAVIGIIFSLSGLILLAVYSARITASLEKSIVRVSDALSATGSALEIAGSALEDADSALDSLASTMEGVNASLRDSNPTFKTLSKLLGTELPDTIAATQGSLESAETSAKNIDNLLTSLSKIPLLGSLVYSPKVPLNETIGAVSDSLNGIPASLKNAQKSLDLTIKNLDTINTELGSITESTAQIRSSAGEAKQVIEDYELMVSDLQDDVDRMQTNLPRTMRWVTLAAALFLIWLGLAQIGLLTQGMELVKRGSPIKAENELSDKGG
ncbi:MAG: hypothetical protein ACYC6H_05945 [Bellilinea sp.]